jgi:spore germination protein Q
MYYPYYTIENRQTYPQYLYGWNIPQNQTPGVSQSPTPTTPTAPPQAQLQVPMPSMLPLEQSYIENILRLNRGKVATVYMTFERGGTSESKVFKGVIEAAGRDHIILSDPETGTRYLLLMVYLDYVTFDD